MSDDDENFYIKCRVCGEAVTSEAEVKLGQGWVHARDVVVYRNGSVIPTQYDHPAEPEYIEVSEKLVRPLVSEPWSWYVAIRPTRPRPSSGQRDQHTSGD